MFAAFSECTELVLQAFYIARRVWPSFVICDIWAL